MRTKDARIIMYQAPGGLLYFAGWIAPVFIGRSVPDWTSARADAAVVDNHYSSFGGNRHTVGPTLERIRRRMGWCRAHSKLQVESL